MIAAPPLDAAPDEPLFTLIASDPLAPFLVSIWSSLRAGDDRAARAKFAATLTRAAMHYSTAPDVERAREALDCAFAMFDWRAARAKVGAVARAEPAAEARL